MDEGASTADFPDNRFKRRSMPSLQAVGFAGLCSDNSVPWLRHGCEVSLAVTGATNFESKVA